MVSTEQCTPESKIPYLAVCVCLFVHCIYLYLNRLFMLANPPFMESRSELLLPQHPYSQYLRVSFYLLTNVDMLKSGNEGKKKS